MECRQRYAEEQPWRTKETIKDLKNDSRVQCGSDEDKLQALVDRNFFTKNLDPLVVEVVDGTRQRGEGWI